MKIARFGTPIEDYCRDLRNIKTLQDVKIMQEKYTLFLDDARHDFERMTEKIFPQFIAELPKCFVDDDLPSEYWLENFSAIVLPKLFILLTPFLRGNTMPSGFILNRLLDENLAQIIDGRFELNVKEIWIPVK